MKRKTILIAERIESFDREEWKRALLEKGQRLVSEHSREAMVDFIAHFEVARGGTIEWETDIKPLNTSSRIKDLNSSLAKKKYITSTIMQFAAIFGVNSNGHDKDVFTYLVETLFPAILAEDGNMQSKIAENLSKYPSYPGTGKHRFYAVASVINNWLAERPIFTAEEIAYHPAESDYVQYLMKESPLTAGMEAGQKFPDSPGVKIPRPLARGESLTILDIGSAPKADGAPTLIELQKNIQDPTAIYGIDTQFPMFELRAGAVRYSQYYDAETGQVKPDVKLGGITYLNADPAVDPRGKNSVLNAEFDPLKGEPIDVIIFSMVYHYFRNADEQKKLLPLTKHPIVDENGNDFTKRSEIEIFESQQLALDRMLSRLSVNGIVFANFSRVESGLDDMFFIIQKMPDGKYKIYDQHPVVFRVSRDPLDEYWPSGILIDEFPIEAAYQSVIKGKLDNQHISLYLSLDADQKEKLKMLFSETALLAARYQSWKNGIWATIEKVCDAILAKQGVFEIFSIYLQNIPSDLPQKTAILKRALAMDNEIYQNQDH